MIDIKTERMSPDDLTAINQLTLTDMTEDKVFTFSVKLIDDSATANGRVWSVEWQRANVESFIGVPVVVNHDNDQSLVLGRIFAAEQKGNAIFGKVYVPLVTDYQREAREKIEAGLFKNVSINAHARNVQQEGQFTRILPGDDDRVFEVSFVAVPGCLDCGVMAENAQQSGEACCAVTENEPDRTEQVCVSQPDRWLEYAKSVHREASSEYIRLAGFVFGDSSDRSAYERVANLLDPATLTTLSADLRRLYESEQYGIDAPSSATEAATIKDAINQIKKPKGV